MNSKFKQTNKLLTIKTQQIQLTVKNLIIKNYYNNMKIKWINLMKIKFKIFYKLNNFKMKIINIFNKQNNLIKILNYFNQNKMNFSNINNNKIKNSLNKIKKK